MEESEWKELKDKSYMFQFIDRSILETILVRNTVKDIWDAMRRIIVPRRSKEHTYNLCKENVKFLAWEKSKLLMSTLQEHLQFPIK